MTQSMWKHCQEMETKGKVPIGSMRKLAADFRAKIQADTNAARGISNALRGFGLDLDEFCKPPDPPGERSKDDLLKKRMLIFLGDEESHQLLG